MESQPQNTEFMNNPQNLSAVSTIWSTAYWNIFGG